MTKKAKKTYENVVKKIHVEVTTRKEQDIFAALAKLKKLTEAK